MGDHPSAVYHPRNPRDTALYAVIEDHLEEFIRGYDEKYQKEFGFWRLVIQEVMEKYLECGDLHHVFAREVPFLTWELSGDCDCTFAFQKTNHRCDRILRWYRNTSAKIRGRHVIGHQMPFDDLACFLPRQFVKDLA